MSWSKVKDIVIGAAPLLGGVLGGPFGAAAGRIISETLGTENTPEAVEKVLKNNPDAYLRLKEIEAQNSAQLAEWQAKEAISEIESQAAVYKAHAEADKQSTRPQIALMMAKVLVFEILAFTVLCYWEPEIMESSMTWTVFGVLTGTPAGLLGKYFGELRREQQNRLGIPEKGLLQKLLNR